MANQGTLFWVAKYLSLGWSPIPIPRGEKGPRGQKMATWETDSYTVADFQDDDNIGVHLGKTGLYDVDLDAKEAAIAADIILPNTGLVFGRPGKPRSHRIWQIDPVALADVKLDHVSYYGLGGNNDSIVELRGFGQNGKPRQTVFPPSFHGSSQEDIAWDLFDKPFIATVPEQVQAWQQGCIDIAIAVLLARQFPGAGNRHGPRLAMAGFLWRAGMDERRIFNLGKAAMRICGGDEQDWSDVCRTTIGKLKSDPDAPVTGGKALREVLVEGDRTLARINEWLGRTGSAAKEEVLDRLNRTYFMVMAGVTPCVADDTDPHGIKLLTHENFRKMLRKERFPPWKDKKGKAHDGDPIADFWLDSPKGRQHDQLVYAPPPLTCGPRDYNGWKGLNVEPVPGPIPRLEHHLEVIICGGDRPVYLWVMNWCAALFQRPGLHANTAIVMRGGQGVGKGSFAHDLLGAMFDPRHYIHIVDREQFYGRFAGELLSGRCLVFLDEATWGGDKREGSTLKGRITGDFVNIDRKGISQVTERSMMHLVLASNEKWPVGIERDDRRFCCLNVENARANDPKYFKPLYEELTNGGRSAFLALMQAWAIDEVLLRQPPNTQDKAELKVKSLAPEAEFWKECLEEGRVLSTDKKWPAKHQRQAVYSAYQQFMQSMSISRRLAPTVFGKELKHLCPSVQSTRQMGKPREYLFPTLEVARREFEAYLKGPVQWDDTPADSDDPTEGDGPF